MQDGVRRRIRKAARNEITEYWIYTAVARRTRSAHNREILEHIALQEKGHHALWTQILGEEAASSKAKILLYVWLSRLLGLSFGLKLMEKGEGLAQDFYRDLAREYPQAMDIMRDEQEHERELLGLINEKFLQYVSSFVLGLNDALVELTGALAGLTLALRDTRMIAMVGLVTGIAASLSMAASSYLSAREDGREDAWRASLATGVAYILTVAVLIAPYLTLSGPFGALASTMILAILIVLAFTFYTSVAKELPFRKRFLQMAAISLGVAGLNFFVGHGIRLFFGIS
jgi:VIT1/CCC1 family predicted Fe2+/Mn2+ transporter